MTWGSAVPMWHHLFTGWVSCIWCSCCCCISWCSCCCCISWCSCCCCISWCSCCCCIAGAPAVVLADAEPNVGARAAPGIICAMARCCCNGKKLGQIANRPLRNLTLCQKKLGTSSHITENANYIRDYRTYLIGKLAIWKL